MVADRQLDDEAAMCSARGHQADHAALFGAAVLLEPDRQVTQIFEYLLALYSTKYGIEVHAYVPMSNDYHLVVTDTRGTLPKFEQDLDSLIARAVNRARGRWESFWDRESYSAVTLVEDEDVIAKMAYTLANPVEARLVGHADEWDGATSAGMQFGGRRWITRPRKFFSEGMPEVVELRLTRPACFAELSDRELMDSLRGLVEGAEAEARKQGRAMGMAAVRRQEWWSSPVTTELRRGLTPTIAAKNKWARIEALQRAKAWLIAYREALAVFVGGVRDVVFPVGTWKMGVGLGCVVAIE